jgi:hypothetical protein
MGGAARCAASAVQVAEHAPRLERAIGVNGDHALVDNQRMLVAQSGEDHVAGPDLLGVAFGYARATTANAVMPFIGRTNTEAEEKRDLHDRL